MKKIIALLLAVFFVAGCGLNKRIIQLENQVEALKNREVFNPVITDSHISLMRMSTVLVAAKKNDKTYKTSGFGVQVSEYIDGNEHDIVYVWTVAHGVTQGVINISKDEESGKAVAKYKLTQFEDVNVIFNIGVPNNSTFKAEVLKYDLALDLALLKVDITNSNIAIPSIRFSDERRRVGEHIAAVGHPGSRVWALTEGLVSSYQLRIAYVDKEGSPKLTQEIMETTMDVSYGYSGSPVFDPMTGKIYGYTSRMTPDTRDALVFPIEYLIQFAVDNDYEYALPN